MLAGHGSYFCNYIQKRQTYMERDRKRKVKKRKKVKELNEQSQRRKRKRWQKNGT